MNELLLEKRRYGLPETISDKEKQQLEQGVPIQKIIGFIDFDDLKINVNRNVLIPRYETQEVVMKAIEFTNKDSRVLDLCTGSGYIGLTIKQKTDADVTMSDISDEAIAQSNENAEQNHLRVSVVKSDMFGNLTGKFDLIVSNPPYIPNKNQLDDSVIKHDPHLALFGGEDGNDFYKEIIKQAPKFINHGGYLVLEISEDNSAYIASQGFTIEKDINKKDRIAFKKY